MRVVLTNAYSARNAGDGLLVELSQEIVSTAKPGTRTDVIAVDPSSFDGHPHPAPGSSEVPNRNREIILGGALAYSNRVQKILRECDRGLAVGGGYLRFGTPEEAAKTRIVHQTQVASLARAGVPFGLLPQSIGPFRIPSPGIIKLLRAADFVMVRDDRSAALLQGLPNVHRTPDLAVLAAALDPNVGAPGRQSPLVGVIVRPLPRFRNYNALVAELVALLGTDAMPLLQSEAGSRNDDRDFMSRFGLSAATAAKSALQGPRGPGSTISVRMHGSLQSILAGVPSVHLSYERKGFSAFQDMGLSKWVHHANAFDPDLVARQAKELARDPDEYWNSLDEARPNLLRQRERVIERVSDFLA